MNLSDRVQFLQAQLFPICPLSPIVTGGGGGGGFLGSFLSKGLKTNQLEVNTDEKTLRPVARLREPRDLFALQKDKDNDYSQQAARWPVECQVVEHRIKHIPNLPPQPEKFYQQTGNELKPIPVGEENGTVVFNYNPIGAVNYDKKNGRKSKSHISEDSSDSDFSSCESTPEIAALLDHDKNVQTITNLLSSLEERSSSNSNGEDEDDGEEEEEKGEEEYNEALTEITLNKEADDNKTVNLKACKKNKITKPTEQPVITEAEIDDIWADKSPEYIASTPTFLKTQQSTSISSVRFNKRLKAGFQISLTKATPNLNKNSPNDEKKDLKNTYISHENYRMIKESPMFNEDMSINLDELAKMTKPTLTASLDFKYNTLQAKSCKIYSNIKPNNTVSPVLIASYSPEEFNFNSVSLPNNSAPFSSTRDEDQNICSNPCDNKNIYLPQFSRSAVGGSKFLTSCHPYKPEEYNGLEFESRFESGNLAKAVQVTPTYYELYLRPDLYTSRSKQWYYFRVKRTKKDMIYRFSIVNLVKSASLYNEGMQPVIYSTINANKNNIGWKRCGDNISYYRNDDGTQSSEDEDDNSSYTLTFNIEFEHDNDTVFFAHSYPYTYSDLQDYLTDIQKHPIKSKFCKLRLLCRTLAGNNVYYLTVTTPHTNEDATKRKKSIVMSARVHPSETPSSWMMKGLMDFLTGESVVAKRLRNKFIFKLIPMLNPDGVIVGNTRNSLTGKDLNRQYRTVIRETYPSIWYTKALIKRLIDDCGVSMYCDMHAHSRRHNIFIFGCENRRCTEKRLTEQIFPLLLHKNVADMFSFENCKFKIQRSKEGTGRIVVWMLGITNSYTIEASFGGSLLGSRKGTHFTTEECLRLKIIERLLKGGSTAEEPINIPLSDYSSAEGSSSGSDNDDRTFKSSPQFENICCSNSSRMAQWLPELEVEMRKLRYSRMRKIMQELDRIYFQPIFHKKYSFLVSKNRPTNKKRRPKVTQKVKNARQETKTSNFDPQPQSKDADVINTVTLRYVENTLNFNLKNSESSTSVDTLRNQKVNKRGEQYNPKRVKAGQDEARKHRVKVSRKLRLWLSKCQIFIMRRKMVIRKKELKEKSVFQIESRRIWR